MLRRLIISGFICAMLAGFVLPVHAQDGRGYQTHIVQPGENLFRIALSYGLTTDVLMTANGLTSPDLVIVGQTLIIPVVSVATSPPASFDAGTSPAAHPGASNDLGLIGVVMEYPPVVIPAVDLGILATDTSTVAEAPPVATTPDDVPPPTTTADSATPPSDSAPADDNASPPTTTTDGDAPPATTTDNDILSQAMIADSNTPLATTTDSDTPPPDPAPADSDAPPSEPSTSDDLGIIAPDTTSWIYQPGIFTTGGPNVHEIYERGQALGNDPHAFSTVGDCNSEIPFFLSKFDTGEYNLGEYAYLQPVIDQFAGSFNRDSAAVWTGNHAWALFDPVWANPAVCQPGETPLACEFRIQHPSVVLIRLGTNEAGSSALFEKNLRAVIEFAIENGVIPVLGTKADRIEGSDYHNQLIRQLAREYGVPLWDFGRVADTLPGRGLTADGVHMTYVAPDYTQPLALQTGHSVQNLMALIALNRVWHSAME